MVLFIAFIQTSRGRHIAIISNIIIEPRHVISSNVAFLLAWVPVLSFFLLFIFSVSWSKMAVLIEINNGEPGTFDVVSFYYLIFKNISIRKYCQNIDDWTQATF